MYVAPPMRMGVCVLQRIIIIITAMEAMNVYMWLCL